MPGTIRRSLRCIAAISLLIASSSSAQEFKSPETRSFLLELYTSEGCSSCPPADRWLTKLKDNNRLWKDLVPVAFHVDYWDYIGWKDPFADPAYSKRQRQLAREQGLFTVYTPGMVLNGNEWRFYAGLRSIPKPSRDRVGRLSVVKNDTRVTTHFAPPDDPDDNLEVSVVLLGFDLANKVNAGENRGKTLEHDFVVLAHRAGPMQKEEGGYRATLSLPAPRVTAQRTALAAWVTRSGSPVPVQSVGGWVE